MKTLGILSLALLLTITALPASADAGVVHDDRVNARTTDVYTFTFQAGVQYDISILGDGDTDLDLFLYDENGNLIDSDTGPTDAANVQVTPRWTGSFTLRIKNLGSVWNAYRLSIR